MSGLNERKELLSSVRERRKGANESVEKKELPDLFTKCKGCEVPLDLARFRRNLRVCPHCGEYHEMRGTERLDYLLDDGYRIVRFGTRTRDPISFPDYPRKLGQISEATELKEAITVAVGAIREYPICVAVLEPSFLMGSMGTFLGEELTRAFEYAGKKKMPMLVVTASGGARMQEGIFSLMQMAKTAAAAEQFSEEGLLYISLLTHPTMGGVSASFAFLADIILAEPNALIGFAGPRVIEQTMKQKLPEGFQRAEKLAECGFVDAVVDRTEQRELLATLLKLHGRKR